MTEKIALKKAFGQNFIQSTEVIYDILNVLDADEECFVIEIGPGGGALTVPLSEMAGNLTAVEIDKRLVELLRKNFAGRDNVRIVSADILDIDLAELIPEDAAGKRLKIVGNIPYNITSPIITKVLESGLPFENFTLMIQKEVADRICSQPGKRAYGYMSLLVQYYTEPTYIRTVDKSLFYPIPNVDSAVVNLLFRDKPPTTCDRDLFFEVAKRSFSQKRKTLANNLCGFVLPDKKETSALLESLGIDPNRRAETLSIEEFAKITEAVEKMRVCGKRC